MRGRSAAAAAALWRGNVSAGETSPPGPSRGRRRLRPHPSGRPTTPATAGGGTLGDRTDRGGRRDKEDGEEEEAEAGEPLDGGDRREGNTFTGVRRTAASSEKGRQTFSFPAGEAFATLEEGVTECRERFKGAAASRDDGVRTIGGVISPGRTLDIRQEKMRGEEDEGEEGREKRQDEGMSKCRL